MKTNILFIIIVFCFLSCQKVFKEDEVNKLNIQTPGDLAFAIAGMNYRFASIARNGFILSSFLADVDDRAFVNNSNTFEQIGSCTQSGGTATLNESQLLALYQPLYQTIASANNILSKSGKLNKTDPVIKHLLGEVYFTRAYAYFWLVRIFGQVPIIDNVDVSYTVKKPSFEDIYRFIENDLLQAIIFLPNSAQEARIKYVTPHRGTAKALLSEVYLTWGGYPANNISMYANAAKMASDVIDSASYFGYSLLPDLADLWNGKHELNQESVYALYSTGSQLYWDDPGFGTQKFLATDIYFFSPPLGPSPQAAIKFFNFFPNNYRKDITYLNVRYYVYRPACIVDSINSQKTYCPPPETLEYRYNTINICFFMHFKKCFYSLNMTKSDLLNQNYKSSDNKTVIYLFRYAHTLLTYAEAKARSGSLDAAAYEAINQVRRRANKVDVYTASKFDMTQGLTSEQFADSVVWERAWEFAAEPEGRWFDLLRLNMVKDLKKLKPSGPGEAFSVAVNMDTYFFPIPNGDLMLNPNLQ